MCPLHSTPDPSNSLAPFLTHSRADHEGKGFISLGEFVQVIEPQKVGLPLNEQELLFLATEADFNGTGWIPIIQVASILPGLLTAIFQQRMQIQLVSVCRWLLYYREAVYVSLPLPISNIMASMLKKNGATCSRLMWLCTLKRSRD